MKLANTGMCLIGGALTCLVLGCNSPGPSKAAYEIGAKPQTSRLIHNLTQQSNDRFNEFQSIKSPEGSQEIELTDRVDSGSNAVKQVAFHGYDSDAQASGLDSQHVQDDRNFAGGGSEDLGALAGENDAIGLDALIELAFQNNPTIRQSQGVIGQAEGNWLQVGLKPNPNLEWRSEANNAPFDGHYAVLSQSFVTAGKLSINQRVAAHDVQRARSESEAQVLRVFNDVRADYITVLGAQSRLRVAQELLDLADEGLKVTERFFQAEQVSGVDVLQARLESQRTKVHFKNAQFELEASRRQLAQMVGVPELDRANVVGELEEVVEDIDFNVVCQELLAASPEVHAARSRLSAALVQIQRERAEVRPNIDLAGGVGRDVLPNDESFTMFNVSVGAEIPIWDRNQGNIAASIWMHRIAQAELSRLELDLRDRLAGVYERYEVSKNEVDFYRNSILELAQRNVALTSRAYGEGEADFLRVLVARQDLFRTKISLVESLTELHLTVNEMQGLLLTGGLDALDSNPVPSNGSGQTADAGN